MDAANVISVLTTIVLIIVCVSIHSEGLGAMTRWVAHGALPPRLRITTIIFGLLMLHVLEIAVFAVGYYVLSSQFDVGILTWIGAPDTDNIPLLDDFPDYFYYSAVCYTTLGFGDFVPVGALRFMTGLEAVAGLVLITWSASFTFLEMQRYWGTD